MNRVHWASQHSMKSRGAPSAEPQALHSALMMLFMYASATAGLMT